MVPGAYRVAVRPYVALTSYTTLLAVLNKEETKNGDCTSVFSVFDQTAVCFITAVC